MADKKSGKVKRLAELQSILSGVEEQSEIQKPTKKASPEELLELMGEYDIGQSENKSGRGMGWYAVHTYSGYEKKVKMNIEKTVENRHLQDKILEVRVPMQSVVEVGKSGKKSVDHKLLPGYVLIHMDADDNDAWYVVRNTRGVTGFVGPGSKPVPLDEMEVRSLEKEKAVEADFAVGDEVMVVDGAWKDTRGIVNRIDENKQTATITVEMFGRETPVEISFSQVKKVD